MSVDWAENLPGFVESNHVDHPSQIAKEACEAFVLTLPVCEPRDLPRMTSGVYFVIDQTGVIYVGKAADLYERWKGHRFLREVRAGAFMIAWKHWDRSFYSPETEEAFFITCLRPRFNEIVKARMQ